MIYGMHRMGDRRKGRKNTDGMMTASCPRIAPIFADLRAEKSRARRACLNFERILRRPLGFGGPAPVNGNGSRGRVVKLTGIRK